MCSLAILCSVTGVNAQSPLAFSPGLATAAACHTWSWHPHLTATFLQVPGETSTSGLSGGAMTLTGVQLGLNGSQILDFWKVTMRELINRFPDADPVGRLTALAVVS